MQQREKCDMMWMDGWMDELMQIEEDGRIVQ